MSAQVFVASFVSDLRHRAALLASHGAAEAATTCERVADDLEAAFHAWWCAELSVVEAVAESGYSPDRLRELVREGRIPDVRPSAESGEIRLRRSDLPRRPRPARPSPVVTALAAQVLPGRR